jgi:hypothetical protein
MFCSNRISLFQGLPYYLPTFILIWLLEMLVNGDVLLLVFEIDMKKMGLDIFPSMFAFFSHKVFPLSFEWLFLNNSGERAFPFYVCHYLFNNAISCKLQYVITNLIVMTEKDLYSQRWDERSQSDLKYIK